MRQDEMPSQVIGNSHEENRIRNSLPPTTSAKKFKENGLRAVAPKNKRRFKKVSRRCTEFVFACMCGIITGFIIWLALNDARICAPAWLVVGGLVVIGMMLLRHFHAFVIYQIYNLGFGGTIHWVKKKLRRKKNERP